MPLSEGVSEICTWQVQNANYSHMSNKSRTQRGLSKFVKGALSRYLATL